MAEGRLLRKKIARDERVAQLSMESQLLFVYAIPFADDAGRLPGEPGDIRRLCAPLLPMSDLRVAHLIIEWASTTRGNRLDPLVIQYHVDPPCRWRDADTKMEFNCALALQLRGFEKNQPSRLRRGTSSTLPSPEACRVATVGHRGPPWATVGHPEAEPATQEGSRAGAETQGFGLTPLTVISEDPAAAAAERASAQETHGDDIAWFRDEFAAVFGRSSAEPLGPNRDRLTAALANAGRTRAAALLRERAALGAPVKSVGYFSQPLEELGPPLRLVVRQAACGECGVGGGYHAADCPEASSPVMGVVAGLGPVGRETPE